MLGLGTLPLCHATCRRHCLLVGKGAVTYRFRQALEQFDCMCSSFTNQLRFKWSPWLVSHVSNIFGAGRCFPFKLLRGIMVREEERVERSPAVSLATVRKLENLLCSPRALYANLALLNSQCQLLCSNELRIFTHYRVYHNSWICQYFSRRTVVWLRIVKEVLTDCKFVVY